MKTVAIVLIRSGSEGLKDKNIKPFCGKPLCFWTIEHALETRVFDDVWISSDSQHYLDLCSSEFGSKCTYMLRDTSLALSTTTSYRTIENLLLTSSEGDLTFVNLQVTSPIRTSLQIREALELYHSSGADHLVTFSKSTKSNSLMMESNKDGWLLPSRHGGDYRRQDELVYLYPTGSIWVSSKSAYLRDKTFYSEKTKIYKVGKLYSYEIDDQLDFLVCESLFSKCKEGELH